MRRSLASIFFAICLCVWSGLAAQNHPLGQGDSWDSGNRTLADDKFLSSVFPNPVINLSYLTVNEDLSLNNLEISIYDILGARVRHYQPVQEHRILLDVGEFKSGIYIYQIKEGNRILDTGRFHVR